MKQTKSGIILDDKTADNLDRDKAKIIEQGLNALRRSPKTRRIADTISRMPIDKAIELLPFCTGGAHQMPYDLIKQFPRADRRAILAAKDREEKRKRRRARIEARQRKGLSA